MKHRNRKSHLQWKTRRAARRHRLGVYCVIRGDNQFPPTTFLLPGRKLENTHPGEFVYDDVGVRYVVLSTRFNQALVERLGPIGQDEMVWKHAYDPEKGYEVGGTVHVPGEGVCEILGISGLDLLLRVSRESFTPVSMGRNPASFRMNLIP